MLHEVEESVIVCGHSHRQFDRQAFGKRRLNAGAVGMPHEGVAAAFWLLLGPQGAEMRRTDYDVDTAVRVMRASGYPQVDDGYLRGRLLNPADPDEIALHLQARR
jgi:diadenosine tetraphosphatase ApaH/serine/threonine PP2A family protein phosphatase